MGNTTAQGFTWGWARTYDEAKDYLRQRMFGTLVQLACPVVKEYHGDLFHDARWIDTVIDGPCTFYFVTRHSGTHVGFDRDSLASAARGSAGSSLYRCDLSVDEGKWTFVVTQEEVL